MKVRNSTQNKVNVITLGCSKNIVDSEVLMGQLQANDIAVTHESTKNDANIVIINTCGLSTTPSRKASTPSCATPTKKWPAASKSST